MIWEKLFGVLTALVQWFVGLLPQVDLDTSSFSSVQDFFESVGSLNAYFPIAELITAMIVFLGVYSAIHIASGIRRLISLFTGGGGA